ncbi:hypothetical protein LCGC14_2395370, partial [marine sediment metagenome]
MTEQLDEPSLDLTPEHLEPPD